jgi:ketosteroid isomerase-like protein
MTLLEIGQAVKAHNEADTVGTLLDTLYSPDAVSVEAMAMPGEDGGREAVGLEAIRAKQDWWNANMEMLSAEIDGPFLHGDDRFALVFRARIRTRASGEESDLHEVGVYTVADGRIVREEFFYTM